MIRDTLVVPIEAVGDGSPDRRQDLLAVEEPLEILVNGNVLSITMRTPGDDGDLATGFLVTEGVIEDASQIVSIGHGENESNSRRAGNTIRVELRPDVEMDVERLRRSFVTHSSCGVCGKMSIESLEAKPRREMPDGAPVIAAELIHRLPQVLRESQAAFERTGGLHAAALFSPDGRLLALREDIGRHNAVDKLIGAALRNPAVEPGGCLMLVSGRAGFELVQKAVMAGIPVLAAVGAPSSLAVETALRFRMTLLGFVRDRRFNIYSGGWRVR